jgi:5-hydroxyisourate hydrolase-like protein (transthyretin family)
MSFLIHSHNNHINISYYKLFVKRIKDMIPIHKCDKQQSSKSLVVFLSTVTLLIVLVGFLGTLSLPDVILSSAFAVADKKFDVDVDVEKDPIKRGDTQDITVTVRNDDTSKRVSDVDVKLTVYPPESDATSATDETDDNGNAKFKVKIDNGAETGEYDVKVKVSKNGYDTKTVNTSFDVIKKHNHDVNDDDNGDGKGSAVASASAASDRDASAASSSVATGGSSSSASAASAGSAAGVAASPSAAAAAAGAAASGGSSAAPSYASPGGSSSAVVAVVD